MQTRPSDRSAAHVRLEVRATSRGARARPAARTGWRPLTAGIAGFVLGIGFWHAIGFWSFMTEVITTGRPAATQPIVQAARIARQAVGPATPAAAAQASKPACIALTRDRTSGAVRREPCAPSPAMVAAQQEAAPRTDFAGRSAAEPATSTAAIAAEPRVVVDWSQTRLSIAD